jgi:hypothetical protein
MAISSFSPPEEESFDGYAFIGADFIAGSAGFSRFRASGGTLAPGADGCYAVLRRSGDAWEAGTDARGLRKLFMYREGDVWAVGTSLLGLSSHLRSHCVTLRPNLAILRRTRPDRALSNAL